MPSETVHPQRGKTRADILNVLKRSDGLTADQLAGQLGITSMAVRKHIAALESEELIDSSISRRPIGRPARVYRLSKQSDSLFPRRYDTMAVDLLIDLAAMDGPGKLDLLFNRRADRTFEYLEQRLSSARTLGERVKALAEGMDDLGYLADWKQVGPGTYLVNQYNCAIQRVASAFPQVCYYELETYRRLLDADVQRSCHLASGDHLCCYVVTEHAPGDAAG
ncbi:MAG TPA: transcriptional regulator [Thermomicrobiales bacterium]|jgi:predicted ArsR family transcriptional regulator|nr:transcriptional regulator [Chloroflexota bacterium]HQX62484.1 transcriptional regulator [Thermomicrobiales bacterium]HBY47340.1 transcriptional regulator [Chloroflexota bacterium]HCG28886.1 transcriptional regulator [Chloroflexota bacterium]HQZ89682.1 transcriptional regulator [Thermomicrobiales bacterium]